MKDVASFPQESFGCRESLSPLVKGWAGPPNISITICWNHSNGQRGGGRAKRDSSRFIPHTFSLQGLCRSTHDVGNRPELWQEVTSKLTALFSWPVPVTAPSEC